MKKIIETINKIFPYKEDIENIKEYVWAELSKIYYKYEDEDQKTFR